MRCVPILILLLYLECVIAAPSWNAQENEALARVRTLIGAGKNEEALALVEKVLQAEPKNAAALTMRGAARDGLRQFDAALADFNKAIALAPDEAFAYDLRG